MNNPNAYPLDWPVGVRRTRRESRQVATFHDNGKPVPMHVACKRVLGELGSFNRVGHAYRIRPDDIIISTNIDLRRDGLPRSGQKTPDDPGACVHFKLDGKPHAMPCDKWTRIEDNLTAISKHVEAIRLMERWGVADVSQMFSGFAQLPASTVAGRPWRLVLGLGLDCALDDAEAAYRSLAKKMHPDLGGSTEGMAEVNGAIESAREEFGS